LSNLSDDVIGQQPVDQLHFDLLKQIPWGHNILIFTKSNFVFILESKEQLLHNHISLNRMK
jgi:hypothetical protein